MYVVDICSSFGKECSLLENNSQTVEKPLKRTSKWENCFIEEEIRRNAEAQWGVRSKGEKSIRILVATRYIRAWSESSDVFISAVERIRKYRDFMERAELRQVDDRFGVVHPRCGSERLAWPPPARSTRVSLERPDDRTGPNPGVPRASRATLVVSPGVAALVYLLGYFWCCADTPPADPSRSSGYGLMLELTGGFPLFFKTLTLMWLWSACASSPLAASTSGFSTMALPSP